MSSKISPRDTPTAKARPSLAQLKEIAGDMEDLRAAEILATGATIEDLEEAVAWAQGESDVMGEARRRASPVVARVYDLLTVDEDAEERD